MKTCFVLFTFMCGAFGLVQSSDSTPMLSDKSKLQSTFGGQTPSCWVPATANCPGPIAGGPCSNAVCVKPKGGTGYVCPAGFIEEQQGAKNYSTCGSATSGQYDCTKQAKIICVHRYDCAGCISGWTSVYCGKTADPPNNTLATPYLVGGSVCP
jgi:hypothetical protein